MTQFAEDVLAQAPDEPVVHWMERPPASVGPAAITGALAGAFLLGVLATMGAMTLLRRLVDDEG